MNCSVWVIGANWVAFGCACAGIVVGMVSLTGIGVIFGDMMIQLAHSMLFPSLLFTAVGSVLLTVTPAPLRGKATGRRAKLGNGVRGGGSTADNSQRYL